MMIDQYILGCFICFLLGILVPYILWTKTRETKASSIVYKDKCIKRSVVEGASLRELSGHTDVIIVGAGVAGAALAYALGKDGRRVHVTERDLTEPDRIVGEILHPGGYLKLVELDLQDCVSDIDAQQLCGYALFKDGNSTLVTYPLKEYDSNVVGLCFHNGRFVQKMREKAATLPNVKLEQGTVTSLIEENGTTKGVQYKTKNSRDVAFAYAPLTIVCDGSLSTLRHSLCTPMVDIPSYMASLILERCELPYTNYSHIIIGDPLPLLLYQISSTETRFMIDIPKEKVPSVANGQMANYLKTVVAPQIPPMLYDAFIAAIEKGNIRMETNKTMPGNPHHTPGAILIGDALNMRHPVAGGGMTIALSDVVILRNLLRGINNLEHTFDASIYLNSFYTLRKPVAFTMNVFAGALYQVIRATELGCASTDEVKEQLRRTCFNYLSLGGIFSDTVIALASGLNPCPPTLILQCVAVGIYRAINVLFPFPSPKKVWLETRIIWFGLWNILPIIKAEGITVQMLFPAAITPASIVASIKKFIRSAIFWMEGHERKRKCKKFFPPFG